MEHFILVPVRPYARENGCWKCVKIINVTFGHLIYIERILPNYHVHEKIQAVFSLELVLRISM